MIFLPDSSVEKLWFQDRRAEEFLHGGATMEPSGEKRREYECYGNEQLKSAKD